MQIKKTALSDIHNKLGAKMAPFGGFEMPISYQSVKAEHQAVRNSLGVFDVSHMGEFYVEGPNALSLLQKVCSNAVDKIPVGKAQYNYFPNREGGVVDDLIVYRLSETTYLLVVNAANIEKDWQWLATENKTVGALLKDASNETSLLAIQGPKSITAMQSLTDIPLDSLPYYSVRIGTFAGVEGAIVATTGYTGSGGIEVYFPNALAINVWESVMKAGASFGIQPVGLAARDTLRLEMGYCLYGHEINDTTNPIAAGLGWITKPHETNLAHAWLTAQKVQPQSEKLIGFRMQEKGIPRADYNLCDDKHQIIGKVTSGTMAPSLSVGVGMGYVSSSNTAIGQTVYVEIRGKYHPATVVKLPFYTP